MAKDALDGPFPARDLSRIAVVGRKEPVRVFEPMTPEEHGRIGQQLSVFAKGLDAFYAGSFDAAVEVFASIAEIYTAASAYRD